MPKLPAWFVTMVRDRARLDLEQVERCVKEIEETLEERLQDFQKYVDAEAQRIEPDAREAFYDWHSDQHWELCEAFPRILRHALDRAPGVKRRIEHECETAGTTLEAARLAARLWQGRRPR